MQPQDPSHPLRGTLGLRGTMGSSLRSPAEVEGNDHFLFQRIFPTQGSNPGLPHCRQMNFVSAVSSWLLDRPPGQVLGWSPACLSALAVSRVTARLNYTVRLLAPSRQRGWRRLRWRRGRARGLRRSLRHPVAVFWAPSRWERAAGLLCSWTHTQGLASGTS